MSILKLLIRTSICAVSCANISLLNAAEEAMGRGDLTGAADGTVVRAKPLSATPGSGLTEKAVKAAAHTEERDDDAVSVSDMSMISGISAISRVSSAAARETRWDPSYRPIPLQAGMTIKVAGQHYSKAIGQYRLLRELFAAERKEFVALLRETTAGLSEIDPSIAPHALADRPKREEEKARLMQVIAAVKDLVEKKSTRIAELEKEVANKEIAAVAPGAKEEAAPSGELTRVDGASRTTQVMLVAGGTVLGILLKTLWSILSAKARS